MKELETVTVKNHIGPDGRRWTIGIEWGLVRGRYEPVRLIEVHAQGEPISATSLRKLPLGEIIAAERRTFRKMALASADRMTTRELKRKAKERAARFGPHRGVSVGYDELKRVAAVYRAAWHSGQSVTEAVKEECGVSASTASKRIMAARKAGLLDGIGGRA